MLIIVLWMVGLMGAFMGLVIEPSPPWVLLYLIFAIQVAVLARKVGSFSPLVGLIYPIPLLCFFGIFTRSAIKGGKQVTWKGRQFDTQPPSKEAPADDAP